MATRSSLAAAIAILGLTVACSTDAADVEKIPVGTDVQLTRQDGGVVAGKMTDKNESIAEIGENPTDIDQAVTPIDTPVDDDISRLALFVARVPLHLERMKSHVGKIYQNPQIAAELFLGGSVRA